MSDHFDLVVLGAGPAGEKGAAQAAYFGKRVCVVEKAPRPGGAALNTGAVPARSLRETALAFFRVRQRGLYGVDVRVRGDLSVSDFMLRERTIVEAGWAQVDENLRRHDVTTIQGEARFLDAETVEVTRYKQPPRQISGDVFLVATGAMPHRPEHVPFDGNAVVDSDMLLLLPAIPSSLIVVGGGVIGCEYACTFAALGAQVTLVNARDRLITHVDGDASEALRQHMTGRLGVNVVSGAEVTRVEAERGVGQVTLADGTALHAECVLYCDARVGNTAALGLDAAGVRANDRGFILVDARFRTTAPHIYAAGDVIGFPALASTAMEQARLAVCDAFELTYKQRLAPVLPYTAWTIPEIAYAGETEESARARGLAYETGRASFRLNPRGMMLGEAEGFVKLVFRPGDQRLLGVTVVGEGAAEVIHVATACMMFGGTIDFFIQSTFAYPTLSDAYKYAAYDGLQRLARRHAAGRVRTPTHS
ncbi:MAG TPA: Si-specific NAD(P)(+) transhydrogenase [Gemmatimonadaceae bacterium]|nr:Si-specific NAD(P)(+) transhydrogenase [Gemmatimonadaceae bacterium]